MRHALLVFVLAWSITAVTSRDADAQGVAPTRGSAQAAPVVMDLLTAVEGVENKLMALAGVVPVEKLSWRPAPGVRSYGEVLLHVASDNYLLPFASGAPIPASTGIKSGDFQSLATYEKRALTREQITADLAKSFAHLKTAMRQTTSADLTAPVTLFGMKTTRQGLWVLTTTHLHEHLGQLIAYARISGVTPPWSK